jgi:hypothetical protein
VRKEREKGSEREKRRDISWGIRDDREGREEKELAGKTKGKSY